MKPLSMYVLCSLPGVAVVAGMVVREEIALARGRELLLDTRPVDPMSLFSGRYATVHFVAENAPTNVPAPDPMPGYGSRVYVWLRKEVNLHVPERVTVEPPQDPRVPFLRGTMRQGNTIDFDATQFYIPHEARDPALAARDKGGVQARVSVDANGRVRLLGLIVEGVPFELWGRSDDQRERR
jgi:uncharacterized membrane-anchored protein